LAWARGIGRNAVNQNGDALRVEAAQVHSGLVAVPAVAYNAHVNFFFQKRRQIPRRAFLDGFLADDRYLLGSLDGSKNRKASRRGITKIEKIIVVIVAIVTNVFFIGSFLGNKGAKGNKDEKNNHRDSFSKKNKNHGVQLSGHKGEPGVTRSINEVLSFSSVQLPVTPWWDFRGWIN